jgi:hypothetical protein
MTATEMRAKREKLQQEINCLLTQFAGDTGLRVARVEIGEHAVTENYGITRYVYDSFVRVEL